MPVRDRENLELGELRLEIDPQRGGRVVSFRLGERDALIGPAIDPDNYGSTIWTSPQTDWGWPPPAAFDDAPFAVERGAGGALILVGPIEQRLGLRVRKRFSVDVTRAAIAVECSIDNLGAAPRKVAPWQISRVAPGGLAFHPTGACSGGPLPVIRRSGATWYAHDPGTLDATGQKAFGDGRAGFIAHLNDGLLFVKTFDDLPPELQAPGEGEVEIYGNDRYVEIEAQGPWVTIPPGGSSAPWVVRWHLRVLPLPVSASLGSPDLLAFAAAIAQ